MTRPLPIRLRLALAFAGVMAIVLAAVGAFVYERTAHDLDRQIDRELSARLAGVIAIVRDDGDDLGDPTMDPLGRIDAEGAVQVLGPNRDVVDATADELLSAPLLTADQLDQLIAGTAASFDVDDPAGDGRLRVVGTRTRDDFVRYYPLVAASLDSREETLDSLATLLLIGAPLALLLASLAAYGVATAALRPVEAMRREAASISDERSGRRLSVSASGDELDRLGGTLNEMLDRLEGALARERRFVGDASHELRTPLAILKAEIALALEQGRSPDELRAALRSVGEETDRLTRLAEDLLVLARAADGALPVRREPLELLDLVGRVAGRHDGSRIELDVDPALVVAADPARLEQARLQPRRQRPALRGRTGRDQRPRRRRRGRDPRPRLGPRLLARASRDRVRALLARPRRWPRRGARALDRRDDRCRTRRPRRRRQPRERRRRRLDLAAASAARGLARNRRPVLIGV